MDVAVGDLVMPGDTVKAVKSQKNAVIVGPGLRRCRETNDLLVTKPGALRHRAPNVYWVECKPARYVARRGDFVVGVLAKRAGDAFKVDIGGGELASLSIYAFEGATKKQKPDVRVGDAIFARVLSAHKDMEPDLVCVDRSFKTANMGKLVGGFVLRVAPATAYRLLAGRSELLAAFGRRHPFEIAIGMNGRCWLRAKTIASVMKCMDMLRTIDASTTTTTSLAKTSSVHSQTRLINV